MQTEATIQFKKRLDQFYTYISTADKGQIGECAVPEIVSYDYENKTITFRYKFYPWMKNCNNVMHGGIISLLMDNSMGWLSCTWPNQPQMTPTPTISMQMTFLEPIFYSEHVMVTVHLVTLKSHIAYTNASLYKEEAPDKILATAVGEYYRTKHPIQEM